jgi:hypothetical protein
MDWVASHHPKALNIGERQLNIGGFQNSPVYSRPRICHGKSFPTLDADQSDIDDAYGWDADSQLIVGGTTKQPVG